MSESALHAVVSAFLERRGIPYQRPDAETFLFRLEGSESTWFTSVSVVPVNAQVIVYGELPVDVDPPHRPDLATWAARANRGLPVGGFEVDLDDGGVWAKTSLDVEGDDLSDALVENLVGTNHALVERYLPGLQRWLTGELAGPEEAVMLARGFGPDDF